MTVLVSNGGLVSAGGPLQPFPRSSSPLGSWGEGFGSVELLGPGGRTVSYGEIYRRQLYVAVMTNKIARQISRLPLKVYRRTGDGRERVRTGRLPAVLGRPFAHAGPTHLKQAISLPALVHGNSAFRKVRDRPGAPPTGLEPLVWGLLTVRGSRTGPVELWETAQEGQPRVIDPADVVHFGWRGLDGPIGVSPLMQLGVTLSIEDAAQRHQQAMLRNGARPPSAITADREFLGLQREDRQALLDQLRTDVNETYSGPENSGKPAVLPPGLTWNPVGHTAVEAELIDQRRLAREEIGAIYDVPPPLVGLLEKSTFNNITELHRMLYVTVLGPWLTLIEETLRAQLIDPEPAFRGDLWVEFDLSEVLKGDTLQRAQAIALQIGYGALTIDEARDIENRPRFNLPETRVPLYPANNLKPVGMPYQGDSRTPSEEDVQEAARALVAMDQVQVARLLANAGGSSVDAILAIAREPSLNGYRG